MKKGTGKAFAVAAAVMMAVLLPASDLMQVSAAADVFTDVKTLRDSLISRENNSSGTYHIVEVADTQQDASLGYLAGGSEPFRKFDSILNETGGKDTNPINSLGSAVSRMQSAGLLSENTRSSDSNTQTQYPLAYDMTAYNGSAPGSDSNGGYRVNEGAGLTGRDLVKGWYVKDSAGKYYENAVSGGDDTVKKVALSPVSDALQAVYLAVRGTVVFTLPSEYTVPDGCRVVWSAAQESIASCTASEDGTSAEITGVSYGRTYVTAKVVSSSDASDIKTRFFGVVAVGTSSDLSLSMSDVLMAKEEVLTTAVSVPDGFTSASCTWTVTDLKPDNTADTPVAKIYDPSENIYSDDGKTVDTSKLKDAGVELKTDGTKIGIYGVNKGTATLKVSAEMVVDGVTRTYTASCKITVSDASFLVDPSSVSVTTGSVSGKIKALTSTKIITDVTDTSLVWSIDNSTVAELTDADGAALAASDNVKEIYVKGLETGTTTLTATYTYTDADSNTKKVTAVCDITVADGNSDKFSILQTTENKDPKDVKFYVGQSDCTIKAVSSEETAYTVKSCTWNVTDSTGSTVSEAQIILTQNSEDSTGATQTVSFKAKGTYDIAATATLTAASDGTEITESYTSRITVYAGAITLLQDGEELQNMTSGDAGSTTLNLTMTAGQIQKYTVSSLAESNSDLLLSTVLSTEITSITAVLDSDKSELTITAGETAGTGTITVKGGSDTPSLTITLTVTAKTGTTFLGKKFSIRSRQTTNSDTTATTAATAAASASSTAASLASTASSAATSDAGNNGSSSDGKLYLPEEQNAPGSDNRDNSGYLSGQAQAFGFVPLKVLAAEESTAAGTSAENSGNAVLTFVQEGTVPEDVTTYRFQMDQPSDTTDCFQGYGYATFTIYNNEWFKKYVFGMGDADGEVALNQLKVTVDVLDLSKGFSDSGEGNTQSVADAESLLSAADLVYLSADGITDNELTATGSGTAQTTWDDTDLSAVSLSDLPASCAQIIVDNTWKSGSQNVSPLAGIVDENIYEHRSDSGISSKMPVLYQTALMLMSDQRKQLTSDLSSDIGNTEQWKSRFLSLSESALIGTDASLLTKENEVQSNIFTVKYETGRFTSAKSPSYAQVMSLVNQDFTTDYTSSEIRQGFQEVYQHIVEDNARRSSSGQSGIRTGDIHPARAIQYIMTYSTSSDPIFKTQISVLEIEPCYAFRYYAADGDRKEQAQRAEAFAENYAPQLAKYSHDDSELAGILNQVSITGMSTAQFCGEIADITEDYDLVYIGTQLVSTGVKETTATLDGVDKNVIRITDNTSDAIMKSSIQNISTAGPSDTYYFDQNYWEWDGVQARWGHLNINGRYGFKNVGVPANAYSLEENDITYQWDGSSWLISGEPVTQYNDTSMNGIVYSHVGDSLKDTKLYNGMSLRYSGNDILSFQQKSLMNFLKLGYPVIVADNLMKWDKGEVSGISAGRDSVTTGSGKAAGTLDDSSVMYDFIRQAYGSGDWNERTYKNFLTASEAARDGIADWLNKPKLTINLVSQPTPYVAAMNGNILNPDGSAYLTKDADGSYYLDYELSISDVANVTPADTTYRLQLYLDNNADGRFTGSSDDGKSADQTSRTTEEIGGLVITDSAGNTVSADALSAYQNYHVRRQLPEGYIGSIGWKLKVTSNTASESGISSHDTVTGMTAVIPSKGDEADVYILQITGAFMSNGKPVSNLADYDLAYQMNYNPASDWAQMLSNVPGYHIHIVSISNVDFADSYRVNGGELKGAELENDNGTVEWGPETEFKNTKDKPYRLDDYDMVIIGFEDGFPNIPDAAAVKALVAYGKSGRSMLFTHDTTSWINDPSGYRLNTETSGRTYTTSVIRNSVYDGFASSYLSSAIRDLIGMDRFNYIGGNNLQGTSYSTVHDRAYKPDSEKTETLETLGTTYATTLSNGPQYVNKINSLSNRKYQNAYWASKVNEGAISDYPYAIPDSLQISNTHAQYYQLNLDMDNDNDGDSDITVWYTLSSKDGSTYNPNDYSDLYEDSPKDMRNNYYIYNRGSITYSGVGHSPVKDTPNEMQLFINTMVASYNSGVRRPKTTIMDSTFTQGKDSDSIPYDEMVDAQKKDSDYLYPVYFKAVDLNIDTNQHDLYVSYSFGLGSNTSYDATLSTATAVSPEAYATYLTDNAGNRISRVDTSKPLTSGAYYCVMVPLSALDGVQKMTASDTVDFYVSSYVKLTRNNVTTTSTVDTDKITIMHQQLFDLD